MGLETWLKIKEFPQYSVSNEGRIRNEDRKRPVQVSHTQAGASKVGLVSGGKQYTRSVKVLVAEAFVEGRTTTFDTPINLDGDPTNNHAENIVWRPRWFACKYKMQFDDVHKYIGMGPIKNRQTGIEYVDVVEASIMNGLLFHEVHLALVSKSPVFPTWNIFDWIVV